MNGKILGVVAFVAAVSVGFAEEGGGDGTVAGKPTGFRFLNNRLTIKPYVALSYTYDSNVRTRSDSKGDSLFCVSPGADFTWRGDRWELGGTLWYRYNAYCDQSDELSDHSYGESLSYKWSNVSEEGRGWNLLLSERCQFINQNDNLNSGSGRGVWRDRGATDVTGALERRFNDRWHASAVGQYSWLDYKRDATNYGQLYGWSEYSAGLEAGYVASKWTDLLISGGYSSYLQKKGHGGADNYSNDSQSWTAQAGLGTHATEKITYRALMGVSQFEYGGHGDTDTGWTYQLSGNWRITRQLQASVLGSSYYQPSERALGQAMKVYALSTGVSYLTLGEKMTLTGNIAWRYEEAVYSDRILATARGQDFDEDILSVRLGAGYTLNRWMSLYADLTWEESWCKGGGLARSYEYDRWRGTIGMRFHY